MDLLTRPLQRLLEQGAPLADIAAHFHQPAQLTNDRQVLTLHAPDLRRVLVYRISNGGARPPLYMLMLPQDEAHLFEAYDSAQSGTGAVARMLQEVML